MIPRHGASYAVSSFANPEAEIERLRRQAGFVAEREEAALRALGFPERGRVLDVGCGPGFVAARLKATRSELEMFGVDLDPDVVERVPAGVHAVVGCAEKLPFPEDHFDCVYARLVLRHVSQPETVLSEMRRVLVAKGRVIVVDSDDGALVLNPPPLHFARALAARQETSRRAGGNPQIGRALPGLLRSAGFKAIAVKPLALDSVTTGNRAFAHVVLAPITQGIDEDLLSPAEALAAEEAVKAWGEDEHAFGMTTALIVGGTK
jgi:ubiquinone/menaquinone biosynthesis C-methylase UbiE